jgi:hypothetical protein
MSPGRVKKPQDGVLIQAQRSFDYGTLEGVVQKEVAEETAEIRRILEKTAENIVQIGLRLNHVHDRIGRALFQPWLAAEFQWDQSTASNYMRAAAVFCQVKCLDRFQPAALYELVRKRVPDDARTEAIDRARKGELITKATAEKIVRQHGDPPKTRAGTTVLEIRRSLSRITVKIERLSATEADEIRRCLERLLTDLEHRRSLLNTSIDRPTFAADGRIMRHEAKSSEKTERKKRKMAVKRRRRGQHA